MVRFLTFTALCAFACATPAHAQGKVQLDAVSVHLFLATSGTLSPDVETVRPDLVESPGVDVPMVAAGPKVRAVTAPATVVQAPKNLGAAIAPPPSNKFDQSTQVRQAP